MKSTWKIYTLSFNAFLLGTSQFVIVGILDQIASSVDISVSQAGQLITIFAVANAIGTPILMMATSKTSQRKRLLLALIIMLLGITGTVALPGFFFLMASRIALGVATGFFLSTALSIAPKLAPKGREVRAMSNVALGFSASLVFGVPIGRLIASIYDWKVIFWGIGFLVLLGIFVIARIIPVMESKAPAAFSKQLALFKRPEISVALSITFLMFIGYSAIYTYITPFLTFAVQMSEGVISIFLFLLGIASLIGTKFGGIISDMFGTNRMILGGLITQAISLTVVSIIAPITMISVPLLLIWMFGAWTFSPAQIYNLTSMVSEDASGLVVSMNNSFVQFGFAVGAMIGGIIMGGLPMTMMTWVGTALLVFAAIIAFASFSHNRLTSNARL